MVSSILIFSKFSMLQNSFPTEKYSAKTNPKKAIPEILIYKAQPIKKIMKIFKKLKILKIE